MRGTEYFKEPEGPFSEWPERRLVGEHLALPRAWLLLLSHPSFSAQVMLEHNHLKNIHVSQKMLSAVCPQVVAAGFAPRSLGLLGFGLFWTHTQTSAGSV